MTNSDGKHLSEFRHQHFGKIRIIDENGEPWFVAREIAKALGYAKPENAIATHCRSTLKQGIPHPQNANKTINVLIIPESDVYRLILRSKLPQAEAFQDWVVCEILPAIRKTGRYAPTEKRVNISPALFIKHKEDFWIDIEILAEYMNKNSISCTSAELLYVLNDNYLFFKGLFEEYQRKIILNSEAILHLCLFYSGKGSDNVVNSFRSIIYGLRAGEIKRLRINAVQSYHKVISMAQTLGFGTNALHNIIRYWKKELTAREIALLLQTPETDITAILDLILPANLDDFIYFPEEAPALAPAEKSVSMNQNGIDRCVKEICSALGISTRNLEKENDKPNLIYREIVRYVLVNKLNFNVPFIADFFATNTQMINFSITSCEKKINQNEPSIIEGLKIIEVLLMTSGTFTNSLMILNTVNNYFKSSYVSVNELSERVSFDEKLCNEDVLTFTHNGNLFSCDKVLVAQLDLCHNISYNAQLIEVFWKLYQK